MSIRSGPVAVPVKRSRAPQIEAARLRFPSLVGPGMPEFHTPESRQLQCFAERLLDEVRLWKLREQRRGEGVQYASVR